VLRSASPDWENGEYQSDRLPGMLLLSTLVQRVLGVTTRLGFYPSQWASERTLLSENWSFEANISNSVDWPVWVRTAGQVRATWFPWLCTYQLDTSCTELDLTGRIWKSETIRQYFNFLWRWSRYLFRMYAWAPLLQVETLMGVALGFGSSR
jgi:hypothetical protein